MPPIPLSGGHAYQSMIDAVTSQLYKGTALTVATEVESLFAEHICSCNEGFINSDTEAVMGTIKAARAFTGRRKIAKVEGAYHGLYDYAEVSQAAKP